MSDETQKTCPRCGRKKEDFAVAWGWSCCYQRLLGQDEPELEGKGWSKHIEDAKAKRLAGPW
ncbi:MAG: hypothetical protein GX996_01560 [Firmicutes bacterium]|nr:hypothetical protein [Bacillota bacterium]